MGIEVGALVACYARDTDEAGNVLPVLKRLAIAKVVGRTQPITTRGKLRPEKLKVEIQDPSLKEILFALEEEVYFLCPPDHPGIPWILDNPDLILSFVRENWALRERVKHLERNQKE